MPPPPRADIQTFLDKAWPGSLNDKRSHKHTRTGKETSLPLQCLAYTWNLKYGTNEPIYRRDSDSQTQRSDLWLLGIGVGEGEEWTGNLGFVDANDYIQNG